MRMEVMTVLLLYSCQGLIRYRPAFLGGGRGAVLMGPLRVDASSLSEPSTPNPLINQSFASFEETNQNASDPSSRSQSDAGFPTTTGGIVSLNPHQQAFEAPPVGLSAGITMHNLYKVNYGLFYLAISVKENCSSVYRL